MKYLRALVAWLDSFFNQSKVSPQLMPSTDNNPQVPIEVAPAPSVAPPVPISTYLWDTPKLAYHSVRVLCDEMNLSVMWKNVICACIYQESAFFTRPKPNVNYINGKAWSTDYGIVQINDYWHIGLGKDFPSVEYVLDNPEACVRYMIRMCKAGKLSLWASYGPTGHGPYLQWLSTGSPMWALAK